MPRRPSLPGGRALGLLLAAALLSGCSGPLASVFSRPTPTPTPTPPPPTPTPEPRAAWVNGEPVLLATYQEEVERFEAAQDALGIDPATLGDYQTGVLQALIDRLLLAQAARRDGLRLDPDAVDQRMEALAADLGSTEALASWLTASGFTTQSFTAALAEEVMAAQMIEKITANVGDEAEQVHARHILVAGQAEAETLLAQLQAGEDFAELARTFSLDLSTRPAGGDLGWFPRGYLLVDEVEEAAYTFPPGTVSGVVQSALGFHIVEVLDRGERPLTPDAQRRLREKAVEDWLAAERQAASIEIFVGP
ncbi:MAG: hypothetical protein A2Y93_04120 [Chloroflexi bacterium RBG_13_68_17]|nr:MAG: hypothetical protein A2Y93_04120 [Chloroflexi bacterium RBG_13_68_17]